MRPVFNQSGFIRPTIGTWASGYNTSVFTGDAISAQADGSVGATAAGAGNRLLGSFIGVEYADASGKPWEANFWTAGTVTNANYPTRVYFYSDPNITYEIQADGSVAQLNIGEQAAVKNVSAGSTFTGLSGMQLNSSTLSNSTPNQLRVVGLAQYVDNAFGDAFTIVQVQIAQHQYVASQNPF